MASKQKVISGWLPMPLAGNKTGPVPWRELKDYRERQEQHHRLDPTYESSWDRPSSEIATAVWDLLAPPFGITVERLFPLSPPRQHWDIDATTLTVKQAFAVAVDATVRAGELNKMLTTNIVFDALAARWSDRYREVCKADLADVSWDMSLLTLRWSWRDLLRNGVRLDALWSAVSRGCPGLYTTARIPTRGHSIDLDRTASLYLSYRRIAKWSGGRSRLLLGDEQSPGRSGSREVANEHAYNVAVPGQRSLDLIHRLEASRLWVHVPALAEDVGALQTTATDLRDRIQREYGFDVATSSVKPRARGKRSPRQWAMRHLKRADIAPVRRLVEQYDATSGQYAQLADIRDQLTALGEPDVLIKSRFYKLVNRRYQPAHFWPAEVTSKDIREEPLEDYSSILAVSSRRGRWFKADATGIDLREEYADAPQDEFAGDRRPLVAVDVSSSQLQILAVFCGLTALEEDLSDQPFKDVLAAVAWLRSEDQADTFVLPTGFDGAGDDRLKEAVKAAVMTHIYGSWLEDVAHKLGSSWDDYGPGLGDARNIARLLETGRVGELVRTYLPLCRAVADSPRARQGVVLRDPYDGEQITWNPIRRRYSAVVRGKVHVYASVPAGKRDAAGDYPVAAQKLQRMIAPCVAHTLDAMFAGYVVEKLNDLGVRDIVSVHDCWMVASDALPALYHAVELAGEPWLRGVGSIYGDLARYLPKGSAHAKHLGQWQEQWAQRVAEARWPAFKVNAPTTMALELRRDRV